MCSDTKSKQDHRFKRPFNANIKQEVRMMQGVKKGLKTSKSELKMNESFLWERVQAIQLKTPELATVAFKDSGFLLVVTVTISYCR